MIIPEVPPARGASRSAHGQSSRKRTTIVVAMLTLATAFDLAGAPTATAAPAATAVTNNHVTAISGLYSAPCRGKKPGVCRLSSRFV
jgi:tripartite-type tricarboxylate transporter receptor subunit TctC